MNIAHKLTDPLGTFTVDLPANEYKDFELPPDSTYPLKGVTYPVDYGYLPGYTGEDNHELDLFVGNTSDGFCGQILVDRGKDMPNEHKFYVSLSDVEIDEIIEQLKPVIVAHEQFFNMDELIENIARFKND